MRGKVGGLSPPYFKSRGAIAPLAPLLPPPLLYIFTSSSLSPKLNKYLPVLSNTFAQLLSRSAKYIFPVSLSTDIAWSIKLTHSISSVANTH